MNDLQIMEERVTALTDEWMRTIGAEHHKDRDCHFFIERVWSYGDQPFWRVSHHGYWNDHVSQKCQSYRHALEVLENLLRSAIDEAKRCIEENK